MLKFTTTLFFSFFSLCLFAQNAGLTGVLQDDKDAPVLFANVALYTTADSTLTKVEVSDETGKFTFRDIAPGSYFLSATYVGLSDLKQENIELTAGKTLDLGTLTFPVAAVELEAATVTGRCASRRTMRSLPRRRAWTRP